MVDNTGRFTGKATAYARYRQRYPADEVLQLLRGWCGLTPEWVVADVGAGTGMLAEVFLENGNRVLAIEPNEEMRAGMAEIESPLLEVIDGTAEATGLANGSVEMVAAGRAFHWFDTERALAEFRRVLTPGGWVALVSSGRAHVKTEQAAEFERLLLEFGTDQTYTRSRYRVHQRLGELFGELHHEEIAGRQDLDWEMLQGLAESISVVPLAGSEPHATFMAELRRYFERFAHQGVLSIETTCWVSAGRW